MILSPRQFSRVFGAALCLLAASGVASAQGRRWKLDDALKAAKFGSSMEDNLVWGTWDDENLVRGTSRDDNLVWGRIGLKTTTTLSGEP